jgi:hypothetical protein
MSAAAQSHAPTSAARLAIAERRPKIAATSVSATSTPTPIAATCNVGVTSRWPVSTVVVIAAASAIPSRTPRTIPSSAISVFSVPRRTYGCS